MEHINHLLIVFTAYVIATGVRLCRRARRGIEGVLAAFFGFAGLRLLFSRI